MTLILHNTETRRYTFSNRSPRQVYYSVAMLTCPPYPPMEVIAHTGIDDVLLGHFLLYLLNDILLMSTTRPSRTQVSKLFQRVNFFFLYFLCEPSSVRSHICTGSPCRISINRQCQCRPLSLATHLARRLELEI